MCVLYQKLIKLGCFQVTLPRTIILAHDRKKRKEKIFEGKITIRSICFIKINYGVLFFTSDLEIRTKELILMKYRDLIVIHSILVLRLWYLIWTQLIKSPSTSWINIDSHGDFRQDRMIWWDKLRYFFMQMGRINLQQLLTLTRSF